MERAGELYFSLEFSGKNISELGSGKKRESLVLSYRRSDKRSFIIGERSWEWKFCPPLSLNEIDSRTGEKKA